MTLRHVSTIAVKRADAGTADLTVEVTDPSGMVANRLLVWWRERSDTYRPLNLIIVTRVRLKGTMYWITGSPVRTEVMKSPRGEDSYTFLPTKVNLFANAPMQPMCTTVGMSNSQFSLIKCIFFKCVKPRCIDYISPSDRSPSRCRQVLRLLRARLAIHRWRRGTRPTHSLWRRFDLWSLSSLIRNICVKARSTEHVMG